MSAASWPIWTRQGTGLATTEVEQLLNAADIVTMARSAVERDYRGDIVFAHDPEMPTRFAKQLVQLLRGAVAIGMTPADGMRLALRCARDTIPPLRRDILLDLANNPQSTVRDVRKRISKPRNTVRRELEGMHMLGLLRCDETEDVGRDGKEYTIGATAWPTITTRKPCGQWPTNRPGRGCFEPQKTVRKCEKGIRARLETGS